MDYSDLENKQFFKWLDEIKHLLPPNMAISECKVMYQIKIEQEKKLRNKND